MHVGLNSLMQPSGVEYVLTLTLGWSGEMLAMQMNIHQSIVLTEQNVQEESCNGH